MSPEPARRERRSSICYDQTICPKKVLKSNRITETQLKDTLGFAKISATKFLCTPIGQKVLLQLAESKYSGSKNEAGQHMLARVWDGVVARSQIDSISEEQKQMMGKMLELSYTQIPQQHGHLTAAGTDTPPTTTTSHHPTATTIQSEGTGVDPGIDCTSTGSIQSTETAPPSAPVEAPALPSTDTPTTAADTSVTDLHVSIE